jgi:DNA-binding protein
MKTINNNKGEKMESINLIDAIKEFSEDTKNSFINIQGRKYLKVVDRLNFVRQKFGERLCVKTTTSYPDGLAMFQTEIFIDGKLIGTGHSKQTVKKDKEFEKIESVSIGRALGISGFAGSELATFEEMNDFIKSNPVQNFSNNYTQAKSQPSDEARDEIITKIQDAEKFSTTPGILEKNLQQIWSAYSDKLEFMQVEDQDFYAKVLQARKKAEQTVRTRSNNVRQ